MERHWLITVQDLPYDHPDAPVGIPADAKIVLRSVVTPNDGFGRVVFEDAYKNPHSRVETTFAQLENTLTELVP